MTAPPATTTHRFAALNGAIIAVYTAPPSPLDKDRDRRWTCLGCDAGPDVSVLLHQARTAANDHASICRALPRPSLTDDCDEPLCTLETAHTVGWDVAPMLGELADHAHLITDRWGDRIADPGNPLEVVEAESAYLAHVVLLLLRRVTGQGQPTADLEAMHADYEEMDQAEYAEFMRELDAKEDR